MKANKWMNGVLVAAAISLPWVSASAETARSRPVPEVVGTLQDWNLGAGYVVIDGVRYKTRSDVAIMNYKGGDQTALAVLRRGRSTGLLIVDGEVTAILVLPAN